jgi:hypothetical protein
MNQINVCCADCGGVAGEGISLKMCKACMHARYCSAACQKNHWPTHKIECKMRAAELRDEALFKDPPAKEDCPICFLPMPVKLVCCVSLLPATLTSVPIFDYAEANKQLAKETTEQYYSCCGKSICGGYIHSFRKSGNIGKCPFCNAKMSKTVEESVVEMMKRVAANDVGAMCQLGNQYVHGHEGLLQDQKKALELWKKAAELGSSHAHFQLGVYYDEGGDTKKVKFQTEASAMAGNEVARSKLGYMEYNSGNMDRAVKHWTIAASSGSHLAMHSLQKSFKFGLVSRDTIDSTLTAYNNFCAEMRSEARDAYIRSLSTHIESIVELHTTI